MGSSKENLYVDISDSSRTRFLSMEQICWGNWNVGSPGPRGCSTQACAVRWQVREWLWSRVETTSHLFSLLCPGSVRGENKTTAVHFSEALVICAVSAGSVTTEGWPSQYLGSADWCRGCFACRRFVRRFTAVKCSSMRKGVNSGCPRANFPCKILKENHCNNPVSSKTCEKNRNLDSNLRKETKVGKRRSLDFSNTKFSIFPAFCWFTQKS